MQLKFMEPQARAVMQTFFKRNYDAFTDSAKRTVNWVLLLADALVGLMLLQWMI